MTTAPGISFISMPCKTPPPPTNPISLETGSFFSYLPTVAARHLLSELTHVDEPNPPSSHGKSVAELGLTTPSLDSHPRTASLAAGIAAARRK